MDPMLPRPRDGSLGPGDAPREQQEAETSATPIQSIDDEGYSGRAFVLVMVALMIVIAAGLLVASRSM